jgi:acyl carrier protein
MTCDSSELNARVDGIFQRLFQAGPDMLKDTVRRGELPKWDSLGHLELLGALEKEFQIDIPPDELLAMETIGDVKRTVINLCQRKKT